MLPAPAAGALTGRAGQFAGSTGTVGALRPGGRGDCIIRMAAAVASIRTRECSDRARSRARGVPYGPAGSYQPCRTLHHHSAPVTHPPVGTSSPLAIGNIFFSINQICSIRNILMASTTPHACDRAHRPAPSVATRARTGIRPDSVLRRENAAGGEAHDDCRAPRGRGSAVRRLRYDRARNRGGRTRKQVCRS